MRTATCRRLVRGATDRRTWPSTGENGNFFFGAPKKKTNKPRRPELKTNATRTGTRTRRFRRRRLRGRGEPDDDDATIGERNANGVAQRLPVRQ